MFETLAGIPAHPLFVHAAVVAVPVAAIVALAAALRLKREHPLLRLWAMVLSALAFVSVVIAKSSGEAMLPGMGLSEHNPGRVATHAMWADYSAIVTGLLVAAAAALWFAGRSTRPKSTVVTAVLRIAVVIIALAALYLVIQTGHEGAMLVWKEG